MAKDAYWFKHDSNAKMDDKTLELRATYGWEGYGIYWAVVETLREQTGYEYPHARIAGLAVSLAMARDWTEKFIADCIAIGLFKSDGEVFYSQSLKDRMREWDAMRDSNRKAAEVRWERERNADAMHLHTDRNPDAMPIREEKRREEENTEEKKQDTPRKRGYSDSFEIFWKAYPRKDGSKAKAFAYWKRDKLESELETILSKLELFKKSEQWIKDGGSFIPYAQRWINEKRYESEPTPAAPTMGMYEAQFRASGRFK